MMRLAMPVQLLRRSPACLQPSTRSCTSVRCTSAALTRSLATSSNADELVGWVIGNGGTVDGVAVGREGQQGLGLISTQACAADDQWSSSRAQ
jgi:hypothetical protein